MTNEQIKQITETVIKAISERPLVPIDRQSWTAQQCAAHFDVSVSHFEKRIASHPGFPVPWRIPSAKGMGRKYWKASEVLRWRGE